MIIIQLQTIEFYIPSKPINSGKNFMANH